MKIVITMSGKSQRFTKAGYDEKSFVKVGGQTVIEHVGEMFLGNCKDLIFIIRNDDKQAKDKLPKLFPKSTIVPITPNSDGPVASILSANLPIEEDEEVIVNYCDLKVKWDFEDFINFCHQNDLDGCLATHIGFHPHRLYNKSFAFIRNKGKEVLEVREKRSFTDDISKEHASNGTYYFKNFKMMKKYFSETLKGERVNNEFYVTMPYNGMIQNGFKVWLYETDNYFCFGTPKDIELLQAWSTILELSGIANDKDLIDSYCYWKRNMK